MRLAVSTGTAKPRPWAGMPCGAATSVVMPMTWPLMSSSGPPELPGLMAASVWIIGWL